MSIIQSVQSVQFGQQSCIQHSQNFLKSRYLVDRLLDKSTIGADDVVYEIGPGKGIITERLAQRCRQVVAIEKDSSLVRALQAKFVGINTIRLREGDFLQYRLPRDHYKVFASIPFNITGAIVTRLTTAAVPPDDMYLIMQREAAEKFLGVPRESLYGLLLKPRFELAILHRFRRSDFNPAPRVDVVMLRLSKRGPPLLLSQAMPMYRDFVTYCFTQPQPSLDCTLAHVFTPRQRTLLSNKLDLNLAVTPTSLRFEQWLSLFDSFKRLASPQAFSTIEGSEARLRKQQTKLEKIHRTRIRKR